MDRILAVDEAVRALVDAAKEVKEKAKALIGVVAAAKGAAVHLFSRPGSWRWSWGRFMSPKFFACFACAGLRTRVASSSHPSAG